MKAIVERTLTRNTIETKSKDSDVIYKADTTLLIRILGIRVFYNDTFYDCKEKEIDDTMGFKRKK